MTHPLVSILIPCYNVAPWLAATVQSALDQTYPAIEIILVDDGSTDDTLAVAAGFASPQVKLIAQANQGASAARNQALAVAQGEYVQYLDGDDLLSLNKIALQVARLAPGGECLALAKLIHFWDGEDPLQARWNPEDACFCCDSDDPAAWLVRLLGGEGRGGMTHPAAWLIPRAVAERAGPWDEALSLDDDGEYFARVILASGGIAYTPEGCSYYRKHRGGSSLSGACSERHHWSALRSHDLKSQYLLTHTTDPKARQALARGYMERAVQAYPAYPAVTRAAEARIRQLGGTAYRPTLGGWKGELLGHLLGWKAARRASVSFHHLKALLGD